MSGVIFSAVASFACASLTRQMWRSANKVRENPRARDQVFRAAQRVFPSIQANQKEVIVNRFEYCTRAGSLLAGGGSAVLAAKVLLKMI